MTATLKPRICQRCGQSFQPSVPRQKHCGRPYTPDTCAWLVAQESSKKAQAKYRAKMRAAGATREDENPDGDDPDGDNTCESTGALEPWTCAPTGALEPRICQRCGETYQPTARGQKYCGKQKMRGTCSWLVAQDVTKRWLAESPDKVKEYRDKWWSNLIADPERYQKYLDRCRRKDLRRQGMTQEQYDAKYAEQSGLCAICRLPHGRALAGRSKNLAIDHDHVTNQLRGLLCDDCNIGLGLFRDDPQRLMNAAVYILYYKDIGGHPIPEMHATRERLAVATGSSYEA